MGAFTRGDVVLFPFPYTDLSNRKLRPCLVLSDEMGEDILLCQITSRRVKKDAYSIEVGRDETIDGSLHIDSYIRSNMIFTASKKQITRKICRLRNNQYKEVVRTIHLLISK